LDLLTQGILNVMAHSSGLIKELQKQFGETVEIELGTLLPKVLFQIIKDYAISNEDEIEEIQSYRFLPFKES
jgi:hypothetical protein